MHPKPTRDGKPASDDKRSTQATRKQVESIDEQPTTTKPYGESMIIDDKGMRWKTLQMYEPDA